MVVGGPAVAGAVTAVAQQPHCFFVRVARAGVMASGDPSCQGRVTGRAGGGTLGAAAAGTGTAGAGAVVGA